MAAPQPGGVLAPHVVRGQAGRRMEDRFQVAPREPVRVHQRAGGERTAPAGHRTGHHPQRRRAARDQR
ncbi:hypothetical protein G6F65_014284 [Rhizopus arrhizus]|nr:hypothetical protein G6F65_014284 [Rhizopus arrhizus]